MCIVRRTSASSLRKHLPTSVKKSRTTTAGPMSGKIRENVQAKIIARTQAPVANVGL
jgi:hypothetical protein